MKNQSTYPLRLPRSVKVEVEVERRAKQDGISVNQFVRCYAVAEKLAAMNTAEFSAERRARANFTAFVYPALTSVYPSETARRAPTVSAAS